MSEDRQPLAEDEIEFLDLEMEDGTRQSFGIFHEFVIEDHTFVVLVPEADVQKILEGDGADDVEISYDVLQEGEDGVTYAPPEERYLLMAMSMAKAYMDSGS